MYVWLTETVINTFLYIMYSTPPKTCTGPPCSFQQKVKFLYQEHYLDCPKVVLKVYEGKFVLEMRENNLNSSHYVLIMISSCFRDYSSFSWADFIHFTCQIAIFIQFTDTGRGLMTKKPISCGDTIISLPKSLLITTETVLTSEAGEHVKK